MICTPQFAKQLPKGVQNCKAILTQNCGAILTLITESCNVEFIEVMINIITLKNMFMHLCCSLN